MINNYIMFIFFLNAHSDKFRHTNYSIWQDRIADYITKPLKKYVIEIKTAENSDTIRVLVI